MRAWRYLTADELVEQGRRYKLGAVRDYGALEACVHSPSRTFDGVDLHLEVVDKAAVMCFNIARTYHPFVDGNKRAASIALLATCYMNGFVPMITQSELVALILTVVQAEVTKDDLAGFLRERLT